MALRNAAGVPQHPERQIARGLVALQEDLRPDVQEAPAGFAVVADLILLNDSFTFLPHAFREGQRIVGGTRRILRLFLPGVLYVALLIVYAEPAPADATGHGGREVRHGDRRPAFLAVALFLAFGGIMAASEARAFFELQQLALANYAVIGLAVAAWALTVRWVWRTRVLDRIVGTRRAPDDLAEGEAHPAGQEHYGGGLTHVQKWRPRGAVRLRLGLGATMAETPRGQGKEAEW